MTGRPGGRRMYGSGASSGSQHDIRGRRREKDEESHKEDNRGGGDVRGKGEDVRISRLTRLLGRVDSEESFGNTCDQIETALNEVENQKYVYRCFQCLCPQLLEVFKCLYGIPWEASGTRRYAQLLTKICKCMENQKVKFFVWLVDIIKKTSRGSQAHVSSSAYVMEAASMHVITNLELEDTIKFVRCVYEVLEDVGNPKVFRVLAAIFVCGTNITSAAWRNPHFQDFIDMVVGWMVDVQQAPGQFASCAELLERSKLQFDNDLAFLMTLMSQLLEDMEQAIKKVQPDSQSNSDEFKKVLQLAKAFTCLVGLECPLDKLVVTEFCDRLVVSTLQFIRMCEPHQSMDKKYRYELLSTVNKSLFNSGGILTQSVTKYFRAQLKLGTTNAGYVRWPIIFFTSFLESISVWIEAAVSQTQLPDDIIEMCDILLTLMEDMQKTLPIHEQHNVLNLVIALLRTRNVSLLQKVYTWLVSKLPAGDHKSKSVTVDDDEDCLFVLAGLSDMISNKSSSILSLWALQPAVFEVLVNITNMEVHPRTHQCALELLKTHCAMHSHFVSSIASTGSFNTDSPGTKFLPALMDFWIDKLKSLPDRLKQWLSEWVFEFFKCTNSYASLLVQVKPEFFKEFLKSVTQTSSLLSHGAKILCWLCKDPVYSQLEELNNLIQDRVLSLVLQETLPERIKYQYRKILYEMQSIVILPDTIFIEDCKEVDATYEEKETGATSLITAEFNLFLYELLVGNSTEAPKFGNFSCANSLLSISADHLIRLKLKTPLGKPQDFFMQLFILLKRCKLAKVPVPSWKLQFIFEVEKKFQLWTNGSAVDDTELTEHVKQFYLMNKLPFLEWLKRIRAEVIECCIISKNYSLAYFNAALMGDTQRMEHVLLHNADVPGLKGMGNVAGHLYLEGRYEEALKLISAQDELNNDLFNEIEQNSKMLLEDSLLTLERWPELEELNEFQLQNVPHSSLLDLQLRCKQKLNISVVGDSEFLEKLTLPALQKLYCWIKHNENAELSVEESKVENLERIRMQKMISAGNMDYVKNWLIKREVDINSITTDDLSGLSLTSIPVGTLKICADYYAKTEENKKSVVLYSILREQVSDGSFMDSDLANKVTVSLCERITESDEFFAIFGAESLSHCSRLETIKSLHQVAIQTFPEDAKTWLTYGDFAFSHIEQRSLACSEEALLESEFMKYTSAECYAKYIQLSKQQQDNSLSSHLSPHTPKQVVMSRLLQLFREGIHFDFEETIKTEDWLVLIAEIGQIPEMRSFFVEKFPEQASLFFTSHDERKRKNKFSVKRRNLFDLSPYMYVDTSEEPLSSSVILSNLSQLEKLSSNPDDDEVQYQYKYLSKELEISEKVSIFAQELLRLASSMEDMWVWSLERIAVDWNRRITHLKKEWGRTQAPEKIQAFTQPVLTYLEALLANTVDSLSPVDVNFLNKHKNQLEKCLELLASSRTLEDSCAAMNSLMKYTERFGLLTNNKLPLAMFSTKLADEKFFEEDFSLCLPGQWKSLKISSVHSVVHALPTKTKPKRIRILATNGKYYDYLVKGTENLNIDCGVMQFLQVVQSFFKLPTRTYSVTPLGKRGGLIQIVPDAIPLFTLYKKHLQRNKSLEKTSEMFWRKMNSLGQEDRSSISALREVYESLCGETSCDLITRELLLASETSAEWLASLQTFTKDCAVGSAIGYLLGIGDRHLDNILVNVKMGKFIHVDFSIIFGKGGSLRVPEKVPFRLTQNVKSVLQHPGPYGAFFVIMQDVLSSFQKNRDTAKHLVKNIAFCHLYDEDAPVDLTQVLVSEMEAVLKLFQCRAGQYLLLIQLIRNEILELTPDEMDLSYKISRRMNRMRRMLVNLNTLLQFITGLICSDSPYEKLITLVHTRWTELFQNCLEMGMEQRIQSPNSFLESLDKTEKLVKELQSVVSTCSSWDLDKLKLQDSCNQSLDMSKVEALVNYAVINVQTYNASSTVRKLVDEATSVDYLAQMYEGWTAWV